MIATRVRARLLVRCYRGVYAFASSVHTLDDESKLWATVLACDGVTAVAGVTAARRMRAWRRWEPELHVVTNGRRPRQLLPGVVLHWSSDITSADVRAIRGLPTTTVARTLVDLGMSQTRYQIAAFIRETRVKMRWDDVGIRRYLATRPRRPGAGVARTALTLHDNDCMGTRADGEDALVDAVERAGLPEPLVCTVGATDNGRVEHDFVWPAARLIVEVDGSPHQIPAYAAGDARLDEQERERGWRVIRIATWMLEHDEAYVIDIIRAALADGVVLPAPSRQLLGYGCAVDAVGSA